MKNTFRAALLLALSLSCPAAYADGGSLDIALGTLQDGPCGQDGQCGGAIAAYRASHDDVLTLQLQTKAAAEAYRETPTPANQTAYQNLQGQLKAAQSLEDKAYRDLSGSVRRLADPPIASFNRVETQIIPSSNGGTIYNHQEPLRAQLEGLRPDRDDAADALNALNMLEHNRPNEGASISTMNQDIAKLPEDVRRDFAAKGIAIDAGKGPGAPGGRIDVSDPKAAVPYLNGVVAKDPNNREALEMRAVANYNLGNNAQACADAKAALSLASTNKVVANIAGTCGGGSPGLAAPPSDNISDKRRNRGNQGTGEEEGGKGFGGFGQGPPLGNTPIDLKGTSPSMDGSLSKSLLDQALDALRKGNRRVAFDLATSAIRNDPRNVDAWLLRLIALKASRQFKTIIIDATTALGFNPNIVKLFNEKAYAQNRVKDYKGAYETAEAALAIDPTNAQAHAYKAYALGGLGDRKAMLEELKIAASLDPKFRATLDALLNGTGNAEDLFALPEERGAKAAPGNAGRKEALRRMIVALGVGLLIGLSALIARYRRSGASGVWTKTPSAAPPRTPAPLASVPPRERLREKYQLGSHIGAGGMGVVFEGKDVPLDRKVAIKKMLPQLAAQAKLRERFVAEARTVAALHHPNIVDIHDIVEEGQDIYLVFEFVAGKTLTDLLAEKGRLPFPEAAKVIGDIALALEFAHGKNIIHRDLKPSNVMINEAGRVIVMDFGLARAVKDLLSSAALTNTIAGTPAYMAPEQEEGVICKQSDVYSLAICLYELLSGKRPFDGSPGAMLVSKHAASFKPISKLVSGLPAGIDIFFTCALAADPKSRPATPKELLSALETMTPAPVPRA